jgi:hypothetical protein
VTLTFPMTLALPKAPTTTVTAIALLTVPAATDPAIITRAANMSDLWAAVYKLYGYNAQALKVGACARGVE